MSDNTGDMNPNVNLSSEAEAGKSVEIGAGETFTSFDALDKALEKTKATRAPKAPKVEEKPAIEATEEKIKAEEAAPEASGKEEPKNALSDDTSLVEVTVDGKKEQVSLQDLKNHYSGKVAWDKKFTELDKERKAFQADRATVNETVNKFFSSIGTDPKAALVELCDIAGVDSVMFMRQLRSGLLPEMQKLSQMSEVERKAYDLEEENNLLRRSKESVETQKKREQEETSLRAEIAKIQETHKIDDATVKSLYEELRDSVGKKPEEITPAMIGEFAEIKNSWQKVTKALEETRPELVADDSVVSELTNLVLDTPGLDANDIKDIVEQVYGKRGSTKGLRKKVEAAAKAEGVPLKPETIETNRKTVGSDPLTFDDLE